MELNIDGHKVLIDDEDLPKLKGRAWRVCKDSDESPRVKYRYGLESVDLAWVILGREPGLVVDHKNRNPLDNRKENLRFATQRNNCRNRGVIRGKQYKGTRTKGSHTYVARIKCREFSHLPSGFVSLGIFDSERDAALAYDIGAMWLFGEFACLNFPEASCEERARVSVIMDLTAQTSLKVKTSEHKGIDFVSRTNKWRVRVGKKQIGVFKTEHDAKAFLDKWNYSNTRSPQPQS